MRIFKNITWISLQSAQTGWASLIIYRITARSSILREQRIYQAQCFVTEQAIAENRYYW